MADQHNPCLECKLYTQTTHGHPSNARGAENPDYLIIGEAPGTSEDEQGFFFVGPSGKKLEEWIQITGLDYSKTRFENVVRCIPRNGSSVRPPTDKEIDLCKNFLFYEIARLNPKLLITVGASALKVFTPYKSITRARGKTYQWEHPFTKQKFTVLPTIHPAAVLRGNATYETLIIQDLSHARELITGTKDVVDYRMIMSVDELMMWLAETEYMLNQKEVPYISVDTETHPGLDPWADGAKLLCWSLSRKAKEAVCVPLAYSKGPFVGDYLLQEAVKKLMREFLFKVPVVGHNIKFDYKWSSVHAQAPMPNMIFDTIQAAWHIHGDTIPKDLEYLASTYAGMYSHKAEMHAALAALPKGQRFMDNVAPEIFTQYACADTDSVMRIVPNMAAKLQEMNLWTPFQRLSMDMFVPCAEMELSGVAFSNEHLGAISAGYDAEFAKLDKTLSDLGYAQMVEAKLKEKGYSDDKAKFKFNAPVHMSILLYDILKLPVYEKTGKGEPSTARATIEKLLLDVKRYSDADPRWKPIHDYLSLYLGAKKSFKLKTSYIDALPEYAHDNIIHTTYNIGCTDTGRFSSTDPSIHTIPKKSPAKKAFVSRFPQGILIDGDLSQAELFILALLSGCEPMLACFREGRDLHQMNAARLFHKSPEEVNKKERSDAKAVSFGMVYGQTEEGLASKQNISIDDSKKLMRDFFTEFPEVKKYMEKQARFVKDYGYVESAFGRRRPVPEIHSSNPHERSKAERVSSNSPIQGTASEITALTLVRMFYKMQQLKMGSVLWGFIHDDLATDTVAPELFKVFRLYHKELHLAPMHLYSSFIPMPLKYSLEIGYTWGDKIEVFPDFTTGNSFQATGAQATTEKIAKILGSWDSPWDVTDWKEEETPDGKTVKCKFFRKP